MFAALSILRVPQIALSQMSHALIAANTAQEVAAEFQQRFICVKTSEELSLKYVGVMSEEQIRTSIVRPLAEQLKPCIEQNRNRIGTVDVSKLINVVYTTRKLNGTTAVVVVGVGVSNSSGQPNPGRTNQNPPGGSPPQTPSINPPGGSPSQTPSTNPPGGSPPQTSPPTNPVEAPGKPRPGVVKPVSQVEGVLQIFSSTLPTCKVGNYDLSGTFDQSFSQLTLTAVKGAENCFTSLPTQFFSAPGLSDGGAAIAFESPVAPGNRRIAGSVSRIYGSFTVPIAYVESPDTFGLLTLNSKNTKVIDPSGATLSNQTKILSQIPAPPGLKMSEVLPDLLPDETNPPIWVDDVRSGSETQGLTVARNQIQVVYADDATVDELNGGLTAVGGGIISSYEGGTVVTLKIPDTGDLDGLDNARRILRLQPKVITAVPIIRKEIPKPPSLSLVDPSPAQAAAPTQQFIPLPLQLVGAIGADGQRPDAPLGRGNVNLFIMDWFSDPVHPDVNVINPLFQKTDQLPFQPYLGFLERLASSKENTKATGLMGKTSDSDRGFLMAGWWCDNTGFFCRQTIQGTGAAPVFKSLDSTGHRNVALLDNSREHQNQRDQNRNITNQKNEHGYLVAGLMAARNNNQGVVGMYPDANARIFAFNAVVSSSHLDDRLLHTLQHTNGLHVINFSGGEKLTAEVSRDEGAVWATKIRQRKLENRVVFVQSAGNDSNRFKNTIIPAENNGTWTAAGLRDDLSQVTESKVRECEIISIWDKISGKNACRTITSQVRANIPRLSDILVVEALDLTGEYAYYSNGVSNPRLAVRAIGQHGQRPQINPQTGRVSEDINGNPITNGIVDPSVVGTQTCIDPQNQRNHLPGFPSLTSDQRIVCTVGGGTSSAAPQVAGLAAWLWSREPQLTASQVAQRIIQSQTPFQVLNNEGQRAFNQNQEPIMSQLSAINVPRTLGIAQLSLTGQPTARPTPRPTPSPASSLVVKDINLTVNLRDRTCSPGCSVRSPEAAEILVDLPIATVQQFYTIPPGDELAESLTWEFSQNFATTPERQTFVVPRTRNTFKVARFTVKTKRGRSGTGTVSITVRSR
ncbi:hypothetical protein NIES2104_35120 [Leptolyngbya sp. NIES-2104]|nr:hypothetical protein NIES2104_35120 [Leptolyngbya sp. NIES-2104]